MIEKEKIIRKASEKDGHNKEKINLNDEKLFYLTEQNRLLNDKVSQMQCILKSSDSNKNNLINNYFSTNSKFSNNFDFMIDKFEFAILYKQSNISNISCEDSNNYEME